MLRKFKISIDGKEYLVEMEEIGSGPQPAPPMPAMATPTAPVTEAAPVPAPQPTPSASPSPTSGAGAVLDAPMPGTILKVLVAPGDTVKENQPVMILEAMKLENEIVAPKDGTVTAVLTTQGAAVNAGDPLISIA